MSNIRNIVDFAVNDQGKEARDALYAEIHDRVMAKFEEMKVGISHNLVTKEETVSEAHDDEAEDKALVKKMVKGKCLNKESIEDEDEEEYDDDEYEEEDEEEDLDEGVIGRFIHAQVARAVPKDIMHRALPETTKSLTDKHLGSGHPKSKEIVQKYKDIASKAGYHKMSDDDARHTFAKHVDDMTHEINDIKKSKK